MSITQTGLSASHWAEARRIAKLITENAVFDHGSEIPVEDSLSLASLHAQLAIVEELAGIRAALEKTNRGSKVRGENR